MNKTLLVGDAMQEWTGTRRLLASLPDEHLNWRPHTKSYTLGELATHVVNLINWQLVILRDPGLDLATVPSHREALASRQALLDEFDANIQELKRTLDATDEVVLASNWTLRHGGTVMGVQPKASAFRTMGMSHMIHHRAQLGMYLRLLDQPVPGVYGPTADELGK
ncbi:DinB family protein [Paenibacillus aceris]|uniref:DinB family protein n=1 Tax=Paenibacillus aceris TaxID=869555 RepID=UPI001424319E|nr:DinB family protein [Paenibacillus aceris]NHW38740.1 DinB family protein [Paenibacillus aceris]